MLASLTALSAFGVLAVSSVLVVALLSCTSPFAVVLASGWFRFSHARRSRRPQNLGRQHGVATGDHLHRLGAADNQIMRSVCVRPLPFKLRLVTPPCC